MRHFGAHILVFMVATVLSAIMAFMVLGFPFRVFHDRDPNTELALVVLIIRMIFSVSTSAFYVVAACIGIILCIRQVLLPFFQDLDDLFRDKLVLEF